MRRAFVRSLRREAERAEHKQKAGRADPGKSALPASGEYPACQAAWERSRTSSWCTTRSVLASCEARSARPRTPTAMASANTSQVRAEPEKARAATRDQSATSPIRPWPIRCEVFLARAALTAAITVIPADTPKAVQPAVPADQAIATTARKAPAVT